LSLDIRSLARRQVIFPVAETGNQIAKATHVHRVADKKKEIS